MERSDDEGTSLLWGHHLTREGPLRTRRAPPPRPCLRCLPPALLFLLFTAILVMLRPADQRADGSAQEGERGEWTRMSMSLAVDPSHAHPLTRSASLTLPRLQAGVSQPSSSALSSTDMRSLPASQLSSLPAAEQASLFSPTTSPTTRKQPGQATLLNAADTAAIHSTSTSPASPSSSTHPSLHWSDDIEKADSDDRSYRSLTLPNGVRALLVSDPSTTSSAVALDMRVGSWHDPEQLPGLAHFCEHMMFFLPASLYPRADELQAFVSEHGGSINAFTEPAHTNYFLTVDSGSLLEASRRLALSFASPSFDAAMVGNEVQAVNSEHTKNLQSDDWREEQLLHTVSSKLHPFHKFGTGSLQTLDARPGLRTSLVEWHKKYYSANKSTLVIYGPQTLDTLQDYAMLFNTSVARGTRPPPWQADVDAGAMPFPLPTLPRMYLVQPASRLETISLTWQLPGAFRGSTSPSKPLSYAGFLLGSEHRGSLLLTLIERGLANSLSAGPSLEEKELVLFKVEISLTEEGLNKWQDVMKLVFSTLRFVREQGVLPGLGARQANESLLAFQVAEKQSPSSFASSLAGMLQDYSARSVLTGPALVSGFNAKALHDLLGWLSPRSTVVRLISFSATSRLAADSSKQIDPYYGTLYKAIDLPPTFLEECDSIQIDPSLRLPAERNPLLSSDLRMIAPPTPPPPTAQPPSILSSSDGAVLWHRLDTSLGKPYASVSIAFTLRPLCASPRQSALAYLFVALAVEQLKPTLSDATAAQLSLSVGQGWTQLTINGYGLSPKLPALIEATAGVLAAPSSTPARFDAHKRMFSAILRRSVSAPSPTSLANSLFAEATLKHFISANSSLHSLSAISHDDLKSFKSKLFDRSFTQIFVTGNIDAVGARALLDNMQAKLFKAPLPSAHRPEQARARLNGCWLLRAKNPNPEETDGAVHLVLELGKLNASEAARARVLGELVSQPFFYELRTVQQLGYIVEAGISEARGITYLVFIVQSSTPPDVVASRVHTFLGSVGERITNTSLATFQSLLKAEAAEVLEAPKSLLEVADSAWTEILDRTYDFNRKQELAAALKRTTRAEVLDLWKTKVVESVNTHAGRMLVQVYGSGHALPQTAGMQEGGYTVLSPSEFRNAVTYWS